MKKYCIFYFLFILSFPVFAQPDLSIKTDTSNGYGLFMPGRTIIWPLKTKPEIKEIPLDLKDYVVRTVDFQKYNTLYQSLLKEDLTKEDFDSYIKSRSIDTALITDVTYNHTVNVLIGSISPEKMVIIFDKNHNLSFTDDEKFYFTIFKSKEEERQAKKNLPITYMPFELYDGNHLKSVSLPITIDPYKGNLGVSIDGDSIEQKYYLSIGLAFHRYADIEINQKKFKLNLSNRFAGLDFNKSNTFLLVTDDKNQTSEVNGAIPYTLGDVITIDSLQYEFNNISTFGDSVFFKFLGYNKFPEGFLEGNYLPRMHALTLDKYQFEFKSLKGKYLLLDFWGTWCAPCIKLIPQIRELNGKFRDKNFVLISVANDDDEIKLKQFIDNNQMDWIHLVQNKNENDIINKLKISQYPTMILIDPTGKIVSRGKEIGEIDKYLSEILNQ